MQIQNKESSLSNILAKRYQENEFQIKNISNSQEIEKETTHINTSHKNIQDSFELSQDYKKIKQIKSYVKNSFKDIPSFLALADKLKREDLITQQEKIAMEFLSKKSPKLDFESFEATKKQEGINLEMQQTIQNLIQKLQMINYLNNNALA